MEISENVLTGPESGGQVGIQFVAPGARPPSTGVVIRGNTITGWRGAPGTGILLLSSTTAEGVVVDANTVSGNASEGLGVGTGNHGLQISRNVMNDNGTNGIRVAAGSRQNLLTDNTALGNDVDARDGGLVAEGVTPTSNQWIRTTCLVDVPVGVICTPPAAEGSAG